MHTAMKMVWLVIPAWNEGAVISKVITEALESFPNIVVVDDFSGDHTFDSALLAGATVIRHPINLGQGASLQTGIDYALKMGAEVIVTYDADGQHRVQDALTLANSILVNDADIVCGSRFLGLTSLNMPQSKKILLKIATLFTRITSGVPVTDAHNGLRAFSREAALKIRITQNRMAHASEIISQVRHLRLRYLEKPIQIIYTEYSMEKGQKMSNSLNILMDLLMGRVSRW